MQMLTQHMSAAPHSRMSVVCPWCLDREKTLPRTYELKHHVEGTHLDVKSEVQTDFLSPANGFWLSNFPDYACLVPQSATSSPEAQKARQLIAS